MQRARCAQWLQHQGRTAVEPSAPHGVKTDDQHAQATDVCPSVQRSAPAAEGWGAGARTPRPPAAASPKDGDRSGRLPVDRALCVSIAPQAAESGSLAHSVIAHMAAAMATATAPTRPCGVVVMALVGGPAVLLGKLERFFFLYRGSELELYENLRRNFYQVGHFVAPENSELAS